jgi:hypothetical protein
LVTFFCFTKWANNRAALCLLHTLHLNGAAFGVFAMDTKNYQLCRPIQLLNFNLFFLQVYYFNSCNILIHLYLLPSRRSCVFTINDTPLPRIFKLFTPLQINQNPSGMNVMGVNFCSTLSLESSNDIISVYRVITLRSSKISEKYAVRPNIAIYWFLYTEDAEGKFLRNLSFIYQATCRHIREYRNINSHYRKKFKYTM